jgi:hypothetical protein
MDAARLMGVRSFAAREADQPVPSVECQPMLERPIRNGVLLGQVVERYTLFSVAMLPGAAPRSTQPVVGGWAWVTLQ